MHFCIRVPIPDELEHTTSVHIHEFIQIETEKEMHTNTRAVW